MISRRKFIQNTGAGLFLTAIPYTTNALNNIKKYELTAKKSKYSFEKNQNKTDLWLFNNNCPGPLITANKNDVIEIIFNNQLDEPSAVHWHGIRNINSMDGVPFLSQPLVEPGESFVYRFPVKDAGTFWYHAHNKAWEQVTRGLYGPLIVSDNDQLDEKNDILVLADDWLLNENLQMDVSSLGNLHDWSHAGRYGNRLTINGVFKPNIEVFSSGQARLRFLNTANARVLKFMLNDDIYFRVIATDGSPCNPFKTNKIVLGPGQRIDILVDETSKLKHLKEVSTGNELVAATFEPKNQSVSFLDFNKKPYYPFPSLNNAKVINIHMQGGAMGNLKSAIFNGERREFRDLALNETKLWAFNENVGDYNYKIANLKLGEIVILRCWNDTRWPHTMHLHGHHFWVNSKEFENLEIDLLRDTYLMQPGEKADLIFIANNPGKWLFHCHMLEHHASGMIGYLTVN